jgi:c-di-GMP-related signal transduction protein
MVYLNFKIMIDFNKADFYLISNDSDKNIEIIAEIDGNKIYILKFHYTNSNYSSIKKEGFNIFQIFGSQPKIIHSKKELNDIDAFDKYWISDWWYDYEKDKEKNKLIERFEYYFIHKK